MEILLLVVLILTEIGFGVFEITNKDVKREWSKRRLFVSGIEILTYLIMIFLPKIDFGFRFRCLFIVLVMRILISAVSFFINIKNEKEKKKTAIVCSMLFGVLIIASSLIPAFVFKDYNGRPLTGEHEVAVSSAILIDPSRLEEFENDDSFREVPLHFYYPADTDKITKHSLPLVIFSHGAFGYYQSNTSTYMELASHGYVVISLDHPYHSFFTKDSTGKIVTVDPQFIQSVLYIQNSDLPDEEIYPETSKWMKLRIDDVNFVIDTVKTAVKQSPDESWFYDENNPEKIDCILNMIDVEKIGLMGHSLGGATAVTVARRDDIDAVIDLDGTMLGEEIDMKDGHVIYNDEAYLTPILNVANENHHNQSIEAKKSGYTYINNVIMDNARNGYTTYFEGSGHMNFTDLPLFSPMLAKSLGTGSVDPKVCIDKVNEIVVEFFDCFLKDTGEFKISEKY